MKRIRNIIIFAFLFRIIFAFVSFHPDLRNHMDWGVRFFEYGPSKIFAPESNVWNFTWPNQPPGTFYMFAFIRKLFEFLFNMIWWINVNVDIFPSGIVTYFEKTFYPALLQLPAIFADFGIAYIIYKIVLSIKGLDKKKRKKLAVMGAVIFLFNPIIWYNSSVWGQYDSVINFFALLAFYLIFKDKLKWAILAFTVSIYIKASLLIFVPIFAVVAWKKYSLKNILKSLIPTFAIVGLMTLPFSGGEPYTWLYNLYIKKVFVQQLHLITANAFNVWIAITGIHQKPDSLVFLIFQYKTWGIMLFSVAYFFCLKAILKNQNTKTIIWTLSMVAFSSFMFLTNMHERYLYPLFPVLTILMVGDKKLKKVYWGIVIISLLNLYNLWWVPRIESVANFLSFGDGLMPRILGLINFGFFIYLFKYFLRKNPQKQV